MVRRVVRCILTILQVKLMHSQLLQYLNDASLLRLTATWVS